ncbi:MAG: hypothetical protein K9M55_07360 [Candidatus Marinimicrobia bacterium]|nr:hypothetical protein [Candidatus Neomarinimicrobiota bacterium]
MEGHKIDKARDTRWRLPSEPIMIERVPMIALSCWFMENRPLIDRELEREFYYYNDRSDRFSTGTAFYSWDSNDRPPILTKFDYVFLKYLFAGYSQAKKNDETSNIDPNSNMDKIRSIYVDYGDLKYAFGYTNQTGIHLKENTLASLSKLSKSYFTIEPKGSRIDCLVNDYNEWSEEDKQGKRSGFEVKMKDSICSRIVCSPGVNISKKRTFYPFTQVIELFTKSKAINFFAILDRILTLPVRYDHENEVLSTRLTENDDYLTLKSGGRGILEAVHEELKKSGLLTMDVAKIDKEICRSYKFNFEVDKGKIPHYF